MRKNQQYDVLGRLSSDHTGLVIDNAERIWWMFKHLEDDPLEISFKKFYRKRSLAQNNWMWGVCVQVVQQWLYETTGYWHTKDAVYVYINNKALGRQPVVEEVGGEEVIYMKGKRFSQMSTIEFSEAVDKIVLYFAERGLVIPLPKPKTNNLLSDYWDEVHSIQ